MLVFDDFSDRILGAVSETQSDNEPWTIIADMLDVAFVPACLCGLAVFFTLKLARIDNSHETISPTSSSEFQTFA